MIDPSQILQKSFEFSKVSARVASLSMSKFLLGKGYSGRVLVERIATKQILKGSDLIVVRHSIFFRKGPSFADMAGEEMATLRRQARQDAHSAFREAGVSTEASDTWTCRQDPIGRKHDHDQPPLLGFWATNAVTKGSVASDDPAERQEYVSYQEWFGECA